MEQTKHTQATLPLTFQQRIAATLAAALLGTFLVYGVGIANSDTMHNAAHDGRHAFAFPCH
ncbi:MAG: CbtB-domain containing protein [Rhodospirillales bacterium]|nr:CbtB-domain containing protein [Rhodospirillales bacterium]